MSGVSIKLWSIARLRNCISSEREKFVWGLYLQTSSKTRHLQFAPFCVLTTGTTILLIILLSRLPPLCYRMDVRNSSHLSIQLEWLFHRAMSIRVGKKPRILGRSGAHGRNSIASRALMACLSPSPAMRVSAEVTQGYLALKETAM